MSESSKGRRALGKPVSIHAVSPVHVQRAAIVALLAFLFFLAMFVTFMVRRESGYLILAAAFLVIEIFTMIGFYNYRRNLLETFENGICYKKHCYKWDEVRSVETTAKGGIDIILADGKTLSLPATFYEIEFAKNYISSKLQS